MLCDYSTIQSQRLKDLLLRAGVFVKTSKNLRNYVVVWQTTSKKVSASLSFYGGHLTLDKKTISEFFRFPFYISDNRWLRWPRKKTTRNPTKYREVLSKTWPKFNVPRLAKFLRCQFASFALLLNAKIGISTVARVAFENRAKKAIINVPNRC